MRTSKLILFFIIFFISLLSASTGFGFTLLDKDQAFEVAFGPGCKIVAETKHLEGKMLEKVRKALGGKLVYYQESSESEVVLAAKDIKFYFGEKNGKKIGVALIDVEPGKWGPVEFIIALDLNAAVLKVRVMSYVEKRGRFIARSSYMRQYQEKTLKNPLEVGEDISAISGATISSRAATFAVKKALLLYETFYF